MRYSRMILEEESPEQLGYDLIKNNLSESSVTDRDLGEFNLNLSKTLLCYGDHLGNPELREFIANMGDHLSKDDILVTAGAAGALFMVMTTLLEKNSHVSVMRPNYSTNLEALRAIGCDISFLDVTFEDDYKLDMDAVEQSIRPETKLLSVTCPHNPTGTMLSEDELLQLVAIAKKKGCYLLVDETYREMSYGTMLPVAASLGVHVISVSSLSKTYGIPGIRLGWIACQDEALMLKLLCAKELIGISGSVVDEAIALEALKQGPKWLPGNDERIKAGFDIVKAWVEDDDYMEWVEPHGSCISFPRISKSINIDTDEFYRILFEKYKTYVGPGHWFEQDPRSFRIGHAWSTLPELEAGLVAISKSIREAKV